MGEKNQHPDVLAGSCTVIPSETEGPFPGDGTNGANALTIAGMVRRDIRSTITSTGAAGAVAAGVPLTINLQLKKGDQNCTSLAGYVVYAWHCDRDGNYSMYSSSVKNENYLRGVQVADADSNVSFATIFPGCYDGRYPHVHFEVFPSLDKAVSGRNMVKTSQLTFTESVFSAIYASNGYAASAKNFADTSLTKDMVFSDGANLQIAATTGSVAAGYVATLQVVV
jgi:protocatechuate 3,4-dioxygenase beta subunit